MIFYTCPMTFESFNMSHPFCSINVLEALEYPLQNKVSRHFWTTELLSAFSRVRLKFGQVLLVNPSPLHPKQYSFFLSTPTNCYRDRIVAIEADNVLLLLATSATWKFQYSQFIDLLLHTKLSNVWFQRVSLTRGRRVFH